MPRWRHPRFRLVRKIGAGGLGNVYLAEDLLENRRAVALKTYPLGTPAERLRREFLALRKLRHPGIARAYHFGLAEPGPIPFYTLEYLEGKTLDRHFAERFPLAAGSGTASGPPPARLDHGLDLFLQAAGALGHLHRHRLLHLDIKPGNFLVLDSGGAISPRDAPPVLVLIDFGLVQAEGDRRAATAGTLPYMAPELFRGEPVGARTDLYALGVTFYRLLTGRLPFPAGTRNDLIRSHLERPPLPALELPLPLEQILKKLLAKDPAHRFMDGNDLLEALLDLRRKWRPEDPVFLPRPKEAALVGREEEMRALERWIETDYSRKQLLAVTGAPGLGKTRFLEEAETLIESTGKPAISLRAGGAGELELLRRLILQIVFLSPPSRPEIQEFPCLFSNYGLTRGGASPAPKSPPAKRWRGAPADLLELTRRQACHWIAGRMARLGLFVLLDDLDQADPRAQAWVRQLAQKLAGLAKGDGGFGDAGSQAGGGAAGLLVSQCGAAEAAEPFAAALPLKPLEPSQVAQWAGSLGWKAAALLEKQLFEHTQGIPQLVSWELTSWDIPYGKTSLVSADLQEPRAAGLRDPRDRLIERHAALPPAGRELVDALALFEAPPRPEDLISAALLDPTAGHRELRLLEAAGMVHRNSAGEVRFLYPPARDLFAAALPPERRKEIHARISRLPASTSRGVLARSFHLFHAGHEQEAVKLAAALRLSPLDPARHSALAIKVLRLAGGSRELSWGERRGFQEELGDRLLESGSLSEAEKTWQSLLSGERGGAAEIRWRRKLAHTRYLLGQAAEAEAELLECLRSLPGKRQDADHLAVLAALAVMAHFSRRPEQAAAWAREGIRLWEKIGGRRPQRLAHEEARQQAVHLYGVLGQVHLRQFEFRRAIEVLEKGEKLARGFPVNAAVLLNNLGLAYHFDCQFQRALATFNQAEKISRQLADENARVPIACNLAQIFAKLGNFPRSRALLEEVGAAPVIKESKRQLLNLLFSRVIVEALQGNSWSGLAALLDQVEKTARQAGDAFLLGFLAVYRAEALMAAGDLAAARGALQAAAGAGKENGDPGLAEIFSLITGPRLALIEAWLGQRQAAEPLLASLSGRLRAHGSMISAWSLIFSGLAWAELERFDAAEADFRAAAEFFARTKILPGLAEADFLLAELALRRGELPKVKKLLERLHPFLARHGESGDLRSMRVRLPLLEARLALHRGLLQEEAADLARAAGLLAQAEGEPGFREHWEWALQSHCLRLALARLSGSAAELKRALAQLEAFRQELAARWPEVDRSGFLEGDPLARCGLGAFQPPKALNAASAWTEDQVAAMEALLSPPEPSRGGAEKSGALLEKVAVALRADAAYLLKRRPASRRRSQPRFEVAASWPDRDAEGNFKAGAPPPPFASISSRPAAAPGPQADGAVLTCPFSACGGPRSYLLLLSHEAVSRFSEGDLRFLQAAVNALSALGLGGESGRPPPAGARLGPAGEVDETRELGRALEATRDLERTAAPSRPWPPSSARPESAGLVAHSPAMRAVLAAVESLRDSDLPVLITGESGTGRETLARAIHRSSRRRDRPFIVQNLSSIPANLFEADFFGHESGAFTGAEKTRSGFLLQAQGGTFLLDEIAEADLSVQQKLLRVLEEKRLRPVGGRRAVAVDVRFLATTQRDLGKLMEGGEFRRELFFRLGAVRLHLPPLRERLEDLIPFFRLFFQKICGFPPRIAPAVRDRLLAHAWPGNLRELEAVVQRLALRIQGGEKSLSLPLVEEALGLEAAAGPISAALFRHHSFDELRRSLESAHLHHLLEQHRGNLETMARELGTSTRSLYRRFEKYGLRPKELITKLNLPRSGASSPS